MKARSKSFSSLWNRSASAISPAPGKSLSPAAQTSKIPVMAAKIYSDKDADLSILNGKTCAVIGFGSQGHAHALNLKDSGVHVIIGLYPGSKSRVVAEEKGLEVFDTAEAVKRADVIFVAV